MTKFWLLKSIAELLSHEERYQLKSIEHRQAIHKVFIDVLIQCPQCILGTKHLYAKYALIFALLLKNDFPVRWPDAFDQILQLMEVSKDLNLQKAYLKFIIQAMITIDEEFVDRHESKLNYLKESSNNIKDGIRAGPIVKITGLFAEILHNFELFDRQLIQETFHVSAQLIDWNTLDHFSQILIIAKKMLELSN
jgi:hypothetical protein